MEVSLKVHNKFYPQNLISYYNRILIILKRTACFLTLSDILQLKLLNSFFYLNSSCPEFGFQLKSLQLSVLSATEVTEENFIEVYKKLTGLEIDYYEIFQPQTKICNLIKNSYGKTGFNDWEVIDGGDGWGVEDFFTYRSFKKVFASSYGWCILKTTINIEDFDFHPNINYHLAVGSPVARRWDCASEAILSVEVIGRDGKIESKNIECTPQEGGTDSQCLWGWMGLHMKVGSGAKAITVEFHGKDSRFWAGRYGARFGYCYAFIVSGRVE